MPVLWKFSVFFQRLTCLLIWLILAPFIFFPLSKQLSLTAEALSLNPEIGSLSKFWSNQLLLDSPLATDQWETVSLKFLTPYRSRRDLRERNHHLLEIHRPDRNLTLNIRLEKKPDFVSPDLRIHVRDGDHLFQEPNSGLVSESVFSGEVQVLQGNTSERGRAALSVCNDGSGLCGLIETGKEHLIIQPHPTLNSGDVRQNGNDHLLLRVDESIQETTCMASDEIHVPLEKLKAASALAAQDAISKEGSSKNNDANRLTSSLLTPLIQGPEAVLSPRHTLMYDPGGDDAGDRLSTPLAGRAPANKKVVEIAVFTDEDLYHRQRKKYPKDTTKRIKDFVVTMINAMDLLYQHQSLGVPIEFRLVHLEIMKKYPSRLNKNNGRAMKYLGSFCDFAGEKNVNGEMWDHALLLTGMDLREDETSSTAGLAWAGTMCYRYYSCSISEGHSFGAAYIITHEIGHSLGMEHDGHGVSKSCDREKYLMSPTTGPGKIEWSPCSRQNLVDFLQYGTSELRNTAAAHKPICLTYTSQRNARKIETTDGGQMPGQKFEASQQCKLAVGLQFRPVLRKAEPPFDNICWMLYCGNGTHAISTHPALEGTKCDDAKYCRSGKCVKVPAKG